MRFPQNETKKVFQPHFWKKSITPAGNMFAESL